MSGLEKTYESFCLSANVLAAAPAVLFRAVLPAVKGLHGDALRVPFIGDLVKINLKSGGLWGRSTENPDRISLPLILLYLVWALLVAAAARPQWVGEPVRIKLRPRHSDGYGYLQFHAGTRFCASRPAY